MSAWSLTMQTSCQHSQLRRNFVCLVKNYAVCIHLQYSPHIVNSNADMVQAWSMTMHAPTVQSAYSQQQHRHGVGNVNDYAYTYSPHIVNSNADMVWAQSMTIHTPIVRIQSTTMQTRCGRAQSMTTTTTFPVSMYSS